MARYRKISTCIHGDDKVRQLSHPKRANGRDLWFYLLTGPHTTSLPGLFRAGLAQLAEENEWSLRETAAAFTEILDLGLAKFDERARVIWLPNAIKHNAPESPNVVRSWRAHFDELPDSPLKTEALQTFRAFLEEYETANPPRRPDQSRLATFREAFPEAFAEALPEAFREGCGVRARARTCARQEQEQEQVQEISPQPPSRGLTRPLTRAERKRAEEHRRKLGGCRHTPACESYETCLVSIAVAWRFEAAHALEHAALADDVTEADLETAAGGRGS